MLNTRSTGQIRSSLRGLTLTTALLGLAACAKQPQFALTKVTGLLPRLPFRLTNQDGRPVTAGDYRGSAVMLFFGYTRCTDECPLTMALLESVMLRLGPASSDVRVLFVTVDPQRDSAPVLKRYVAQFDPRFVGLRGSSKELGALTRRYRVIFNREKPDQEGDYDVQHSSAVFIFDFRGRPRLIASETDSVGEIAHDLRRLIGQG